MRISNGLVGSKEQERRARMRAAFADGAVREGAVRTRWAGRSDAAWTEGKAMLDGSIAVSPIRIAEFVSVASRLMAGMLLLKAAVENQENADLFEAAEGMAETAKQCRIVLDACEHPVLVASGAAAAVREFGEFVRNGGWTDDEAILPAFDAAWSVVERVMVAAVTDGYSSLVDVTKMPSAADELMMLSIVESSAISVECVFWNVPSIREQPGQAAERLVLALTHAMHGCAPAAEALDGMRRKVLPLLA
ncbi:protein of unknown function (plasmid) [Magnetospirillum sp. XM-1]|nr:protein of unknown function [Magnetospirillum sp. XM-1]